VFTALIYLHLGRITRLVFRLSILCTKLTVSACMAFLVHTLLQFSSAYVHAVYQSPDQQFGLVRGVARGGFAYFTRAFANGTNEEL
jgi:hypothetical protein